jgi:membrane-bound inhibitor of C-type lysozyme
MRPSYFIVTAVSAAAMSWQTAALAQQTLSTYQCRDGAQFVAAFYQGDKAAHLQLDGKAVRLPKRVAAVGTRYAKGDITLRIMKTSTTLQRGKRMTECTAK